MQWLDTRMVGERKRGIKVSDELGEKTARQERVPRQKALSY